jgi:hypothetical protein
LDLSSQYPGLAKKDVKLITGNLLEVGEKVLEKNPNAKQSRQMGRQVEAAVNRLEAKMDKTAAEEVLVGRVKAKRGKVHRVRRQPIMHWQEHRK